MNLQKKGTNKYETKAFPIRFLTFPNHFPLTNLQTTDAHHLKRQPAKIKQRDSLNFLSPFPYHFPFNKPGTQDRNPVKKPTNTVTQRVSLYVPLHFLSFSFNKKLKRKDRNPPTKRLSTNKGFLSFFKALLRDSYPFC